MKSAGILYIVATPIGNRGDLSERAREVLGSVETIAAEDTRYSGALLASLGIAKPMLSLHEHNESRRIGELLARLQAGESVAVVSDAGTPLISDPGFDLVRAAIAAHVRVVPIPGPCAVIAALSVAGLPTDKFVFEGFLAAKSSARCEQLAALKHETRTLVFYEAPHRIVETLQDMAERLGGARQATVARELTKQFETLYHASLAELAARAKDDNDMQRGEIVIVVAGAAASAVQTTQLDAAEVLRVLMEELPASQAAKLAARLTGAKRSELYEMAVAVSEERKRS
ncbi:MAG: 16S rRNA (cytidine(1402)-2'-O)-methyltransferase [Candidatus Obscuribacterales bacterium]|nr:16S rRNA (cytidine(1402)-2'-O)-methyltransferase [Steroidobacteraceae bacterium]